MVDGTVLGTTIVSLMVNGLCCVYQQKEEKEQREAIRRDLRAEYWQQRMDLEIEHRRGGPSEERDEASPSSSVVSEERRRKLQQDKQRAVGYQVPAMMVTPTSSAASSLQNTPTRRPGSRAITDLRTPTRMVKATSLMDESDDEESDSEGDEARCRSNSLFDEDDSQEVQHTDDGFVEVSLV